MWIYGSIRLYPHVMKEAEKYMENLLLYYKKVMIY